MTALPRPQDLASLPRPDRNRILLDLATSSAFDFIDFGTHKGNGITFGKTNLGGRLGMGVELNDAKAVEALKNGFYVYSGDATQIPLQGRHFKFAVCRHVLEHLPDVETVSSVLVSLGRVCSEFIYIEQPDITHESYLNSLGLMTMSVTLTYHTCLLTEQGLTDVLRASGLNSYSIGHLVPMRDSKNKWLQAVGAAPNRWEWTEADLPKPDVTFEKVIYRDIVIIAGLSPRIDTAKVLNKVPGIAVAA